MLASFGLAVLYTFSPEYLNDFSQLDFLGDKRFYCYYFYFAFGYFLSSRRLTFSLHVSVLALMLFLFAYVSFEGEWLSALFEVFANCAIIFIVFRVCQGSVFSSSSLFVRVGRITLPIYLWHVLPILLAKKAILPHGDVAYYLFSCVFMVLLAFILLWLERKSNFIDLIFYGHRSNQSA